MRPRALGLVSPFRALVTLLALAELSHTVAADGVTEYQSWLINNGCIVNKLRLRDFEGYGLGWEVAEPVEEGELLLGTPQKLQLDSSVVFSSPVSTLIRGHTGIGLDASADRLPMMVFLLYALHQPLSRWAPMLKMLPRHTTHPVMFSDAELEQLQGSPAKAHIEAHQATIRKLLDIMSALSKQRPLLIPPSSVTLQTVGWLFVVLLTRAVSKQHLIIPTGVDIVNHKARGSDQTISRNIGFTEHHQAVFARAASKLAKGQQFFVSYGEGRTLADYFATYGIVNVDAPRVAVDITFKYSWDATKQELACEFQSLLDLPQNQTNCFVSYRNELETLVTIRDDIVKGALAAYQTSIQHDLVLLQSKNLSRAMRAIVELRYHEKQTYVNISKSLGTRWAAAKSLSYVAQKCPIYLDR